MIILGDFPQICCSLHFSVSSDCITEVLVQLLTHHAWTSFYSAAFFIMVLIYWNQGKGDQMYDTAWGVNLVWILGVSWILNSQQMEAHITWLRVLSLLFYLIIYKSFFYEVTNFGKCSHLLFLFIIGYNISWTQHDHPHTKIWGL